MSGIRTIFALFLAVSLHAQLTPRQKAENLESFEQVWRTVRDRHPDPTLNGLDWQAVRQSTRPLIVKAQSIEDVRSLLRGMLAKLSASHYAIIPADMYSPSIAPGALKTESAPPADISKPLSAAGSTPVQSALPNTPEPVGRISPGTIEPKTPVSTEKIVTFGNLPQTRIVFEVRELPGGAGYIRFNEFLDPVSVMPQVEAALRRFAKAPGVVLDLRGNPGGIGIMAMGIAGFFVDKEGQKLGEMKMREATLKFVIFPRAETYAGPLAILVDSGSASTTEILAQGLQDLGRARIFGAVTAGAALPSDIVRLPNGDGFQFAQASYTSEKGRVLEGNGVKPDVEVRQTPEALAKGHDLVIEAANDWITSLRR